jgi:hypothetical protein
MCKEVTYISEIKADIRYSGSSINPTSVHKYNQSIPLVYIGFILSLLHVSVCLDQHQAVKLNKYSHY